MPFAKYVDKDVGKKLLGKYNQKLLDHAKQSEAVALKTTSKKSNSRNSRSQCDLNGNKIADGITEASSNRVIQWQLKKSMIKKYLKKDIYL